MTVAAPAIRVRHLWHRYGNVDVLKDVSFEVGHGEIFGFIGPNGAGKTTTIRIMATLLDPLAGQVEIDGVDVTVDPDKVRRIIGYMPDHAGVYDRITVREFLEFFADAYEIPDASVVDAVIELTDLGKLQDRLVIQLSKGLKQRLQVARILLHDPKVLILDEPASDLDPRARIEVRDLLLELRDLGKTIFLSSHILTELSDICSSVGILERGKLVVAGPIAEIAERLASARAAPENPSAVAPSAASHATEASPQTVAAAPTMEQAAEAEAQPHVHSAHLAHPMHAHEPLPAQEPPTTAGGAVIPAATRKRLRLRIIGDARAVTPLISGGVGVIGVEAGPFGQLTVHYTGNEHFVAQLVRHLVTQGVPIIGVEPERNELERIFLEVTRGDLQ